MVTAADGSVAHAATLPAALLQRVLGLGATEAGRELSTHVYSDDARVLCAAHDAWSERVKAYEDPPVQAIGAAAFAQIGEQQEREGAAVRACKVVWWGEPSHGR